MQAHNPACPGYPVTPIPSLDCRELQYVASDMNCYTPHLLMYTLAKLIRASERNYSGDQPDLDPTPWSTASPATVDAVPSPVSSIVRAQTVREHIDFVWLTLLQRMGMLGYVRLPLCIKRLDFTLYPVVLAPTSNLIGALRCLLCRFHFQFEGLRRWSCTAARCCASLRSKGAPGFLRGCRLWSRSRQIGSTRTGDEPTVYWVGRCMPPQPSCTTFTGRRRLRLGEWSPLRFGSEEP